MARITVADCIKNVESRFELVLIAAHRAREIASGIPALVPKNNDKPVVTALREVAAECVSVETAIDNLITKRQKFQAFDEKDVFDTADNILDEELFDALSDEQESKSIVNTNDNAPITNMYATESYEDEYEGEGESTGSASKKAHSRAAVDSEDE